MKTENLRPDASNKKINVTHKIPRPNATNKNQKPKTQIKVRNLMEKTQIWKHKKNKKWMQIHDRWTKDGQKQGARHQDTT